MKKYIIALGVMLVVIKLSSDAQSWFNPLATLDEIKQELRNHDYNDINSYNGDGLTGLMYAAKWGDFDKLRLLIHYGADVNKVSFDVPLNRDNDRNTALHYACIFGDNDQAEDIIRELVDHGADVNARNVDGDTPINLLTIWMQDQQKRGRVLRFLVDHNADLNAQNKRGNALLHLAAAKSDGTWIYQVAGLYPTVINFQLKNSAGQTPLMLALSLGFGDMAAVLGDIERDIRAALTVADRDGFGRTPLMVAIMRNDRALTQELINRGSDLDAQDANGYTPLLIALSPVIKNSIDFLKIILAANRANVNMGNPNGDTPLLTVAQLPNARDRQEAIQLLIERGADINARNKQGDTLMHKLVRKRDTSLITYLKNLSSSIDPLLKNNNGLTAAEEAKNAGLVEIAAMLEK